MNELRLLHLCDSLLPLGGFAYSDGLETATSSGAITSAGDLAAWLDVCLDETIGRMEGPGVRQAWAAFDQGDWDALAALDEELTALRPCANARRSSRAMGLRLLTTWHALHAAPRLAQAIALARGGRFGPVLPIAFAAACVCAGIEPRRAVAAFAYTRLAATISAAMRLMPIGQTDAHALLARATDRVPAVADAVMTRETIESFAPAADLAAMSQQYLHSRLFRT